MKTWFITGANRGLGLEIARAALSAGDRVIATARKPDAIADALPGHGDRLYTIALNVADHRNVERAASEATQRFGRVDILVNNAGYGQLGAFEEIDPDKLIQQFETNVFGVFDVTRALLPTMRRQRAGHIVTISSIAGITGFPGSSVYCATKHAVSGWSEGLAQEVEAFGIKVTCVYPGRFRTDFLDETSVHYGTLGIDGYKEISAKRKKALDENNHLQTGDPVKFAQAILELANSGHPPVWFGAGSDAYEVFNSKADALRRNTNEWKDLMLSTDIDE